MAHLQRKGTCGREMNPRGPFNMCVRKDNKTVLYLIGRIRSEKQRDPATKQATAKKKRTFNFLCAHVK